LHEGAIEVVSKPWITPAGKARADSKSFEKMNHLPREMSASDDPLRLALVVLHVAEVVRDQLPDGNRRLVADGDG
jgi:hypothetical protein